LAARYEFEDNGCITKTMTILNGKGDVSLVTIADFKLVPLNELVILTSNLS
jgi:hypothetical protein